MEDNGVRFAVLDTIANDLPDDPAGLIEANRKLLEELSLGDPSWELGVEAYMIRLKSRYWSLDECIALAVRWAAKSNAKKDDPTLQELAKCAAKYDPELAAISLERFPEQARSFFVAEVIKELSS